ncbi:polysaccharide pyruvyl transferase CsaB [Bacillus cereus]|uniref:Polysaccharide pyruvyl transferase CsaB n=1 Tax=Bacillus cereus (strain VD014) TaxID=1053223 RepID=A0A9W5KC46_BACC8|nr:polysaccharide pyruvyl transferase CsaB [Bacillus cereus]EJR25658.1 polysaccharide pyruvyl transferase CsaB [Bacillus cereus VD014]HDR8154920.1 polysaccharide pyruvyl transferase CsaB [Bacillus cereus]
MRLVLSGYYGFYNVGDEAILQSIIESLSKENPDIELVVLSNDSKYTKEMYGVESVDRWDIKAVYHAIKNSDGVISGGGSLLQDQTSTKSILYYTGIMGLARLLKKPYYIYSQGIGPITKRYNRLLVKWNLSKASYVSVRDEDSFLYLKELGIKNDIEIVPDPVLTWKRTKQSDWLQKHSIHGKVIAVSVRYWNAKEDYIKKLAAALKKLKQEGYQILFVPMHEPFDQKASREVVDLMGEETYMLPYKMDIDEKIFILSQCSLLIGMRLHALVFSAVAKTPMVGISYDPKIDSFLSQVNQPVIGSVDGEWSAEYLYEIAKKQLMQQGTVQQELQLTIDELRLQGKQATKKLIDHMEKGTLLKK